MKIAPCAPANIAGSIKPIHVSALRMSATAKLKLTIRKEITMPTYCVNSQSLIADRYELHSIGTQVIATFWRDSEKVASIGLTGDWSLIEQSHTAPVLTGKPFLCHICNRPLDLMEIYSNRLEMESGNYYNYCSLDCASWLERLNAAANAAESAQEGQDSPVLRTLDELMTEAETNGYGEIHHPFYARAAAAAGEAL